MLLALFSFFWEIVIFQEEERDFEKKQTNNKNGPVFDFVKGKKGPIFNFIAHIYIYMYML